MKIIQVLISVSPISGCNFYPENFLSQCYVNTAPHLFSALSIRADQPMTEQGREYVWTLILVEGGQGGDRETERGWGGGWGG